jgi:hypothetical protein
MTYRTSIRFGAGVITLAGPEPASSPRVSLAHRMTGSKLLVPLIITFAFVQIYERPLLSTVTADTRKGLFRRADQEAWRGGVAGTSPPLGDMRPFGLHSMNVFREGQTR